ncbi:hypothetical protein Skr01_25930 [Sphaerisporangium krabiense]|uniref:Putative polyphosphate/ATP-dependent NAD kinase n=1 Tax=Sphaerisporangium krabiense TaxID=763782 RepID=A0A7W8ZB98_9ACTN|nr:NAD(+)/NADH kinase [Sphaerisporangium krabiense]MBB5630538.1 putative polyphosphate/ATP-dependent NAD kinase [Sphaerisporangium krabiense]GII62508.1 hypothetical protein Skr01_25930 [Sphaerisporangium krabiense]
MEHQISATAGTGAGLTVGLVVNPVAGLGGPAGLKGSDGADVQREALARGSVPRAGARAARAVRALLAAAPGVRLVTMAGAMGEDSVRAAGGSPRLTGEARPAGATSAADTRAAVAAMAEADLVLFAGGDGTARDVLDALRPLGADAPAVLGVPAGVKVYSGCFAVSPAAAGLVAAGYTPGAVAEAEVVDLDEELYRDGLVGPRLYGTVRVPADARRLSGRKTGSSAAGPGSAEGVAREVVSRMRPGVRYALGPGATTMAVGRELGLATTLLGVDVVEAGPRPRLLGADVTEARLFDLVRGHEALLVLSVIGGQGFVLGRGNQQISPRVLRAVARGGPGRRALVVLATQQKLAGLRGRPLLADTGDPDTDLGLAGHVQVITGHHESTVYRIAAASEEYAQ